MSSTAAAAVRSVRRITAWADPAALQRARLTVVPRAGRTAAPRLPFIALITAILLAGVIGLLMFNTSMQQAAFVESRLQTQADNLAARQQALQSDIERLKDPQVIADKARRLGMVIAGSPAVLNVPAGTIAGEPQAANGDATPQLWAHNPKPTAVQRAGKPVTGPSKHANKQSGAKQQKQQQKQQKKQKKSAAGH